MESPPRGAMELLELHAQTVPYRCMAVSTCPVCAQCFPSPGTLHTCGYSGSSVPGGHCLRPSLLQNVVCRLPGGGGRPYSMLGIIFLIEALTTVTLLSARPRLAGDCRAIRAGRAEPRLVLLLDGGCFPQHGKTRHQGALVANGGLALLARCKYVSTYRAIFSVVCLLQAV